jgi:hypothetical protein
MATKHALAKRPTSTTKVKTIRRGGETISVRSSSGGKSSPALWIGLAGGAALLAAFFLSRTASAATTASASSSSVAGTTWVPVNANSAGMTVLGPGSYLISLNAAAIAALSPTNATLATAISVLQAWGFTVVSSHDTNDIPQGWPSDDQGAGEWRFQVSLGPTQSVSLKLSAGERVYAAQNNPGGGASTTV